MLFWVFFPELYTILTYHKPRETVMLLPSRGSSGRWPTYRLSLTSCAAENWQPGRPGSGSAKLPSEPNGLRLQSVSGIKYTFTSG